MKISKKIALSLFLSFLLFSSNAYAITKLDGFEVPQDIAEKIQKTKSKIEEKYTQTMQKVNEKVKKAFGAEGFALFQQVLKYGKNIIKQAISGQLNAGDFSASHMLGAMKSQLGNFKLDLANMMALSNDYLNAVHAERAAKNAGMQLEQAELLAKHDALSKVLAQSATDDEYKKYQELSVQERELQKAIAERDVTRKYYQKQREKAEKENKKMQGYIETIKSGLGENVSADDNADIEAYEKAIAMNNDIIRKIDGQTDEYDSLIADLENTQAAKASLVEALQASVDHEVLQELEEINQSIASLDGQMIKNTAADVKQSGYENQIAALSSQLNDLMTQFSAEALMGNLKSQADALLSGMNFNSLFNGSGDNSGLYTDEVKEVFLGKSEVLNPTTAARVNKNRNKGFYEAHKNLLEVVLNSYKMTAEVSESSEGCLNASTQQADSVFGAMTMRVCTDVQSAKMALQYADLLLAQIWYEAAKDLQSWNDRLQMSNYDKDMTTLNLDDYVLDTKGK